MQLHEIKPIHKLKKGKRVGRGGKRGTYSGHGVKGQRARAGRRFKPAIRELIKKYPKLRGYRQKSKIQNPKSKMVILNLETLEKKFNSGEKITPQTLLEKKLIRRIEGRLPQVKILGRHPPSTLPLPKGERAPGEITKALTLEGCQISKSAKEKIEKAGGKIS